MSAISNKAEIRPGAFIPNAIAENHIPKKFTPDQLSRGTSVFYRGERYWVETPSLDWNQSPFVRISSLFVSPNEERPPGNAREHFAVHADLLELAPVNKKGQLHKQPTKSALERQERAKGGITDAGDAIGEALRGRTIDEAYLIAGAFLGTHPDDLKDRYLHLNPGQQKMNLLNRMRAHARKMGLK